MASEHRSWWPEWRCSRSARPASVPANWSASDYAWPQIALYPVPQLYGGWLLWPVEMAFPVLHAFRTVTSGAPDEFDPVGPVPAVPPDY